MKRTVYKTYKNCIELKHYDVESALKKEEAIVVDLVEDGVLTGSMTIQPDDLNDWEWHEKEQGKKIRPNKVEGLDYYLVGYRWINDPKSTSGIVDIL